MWKGDKPTEFAIDVSEQHDENAFFIAQYAYNHIVTGSPVDTGNYRRNNHFSIGKPNFMVIVGGSGGQPKAGNFCKYFISNGIEYGEAIENGHSEEQAPKGVYGVAATAVRARYFK